MWLYVAFIKCCCSNNKLWWIKTFFFAKKLQAMKEIKSRGDGTSDPVPELERKHWFGHLNLSEVWKDRHYLVEYQTPSFLSDNFFWQKGSAWQGNRGADLLKGIVGWEREQQGSPAWAGLWHHKAFPCRPLTPRTSGQKGSTEEAHPPLQLTKKTFNPFADKGWTPDQTWHLRGFMNLFFRKLIFVLIDTRKQP